MKKSSRTYRFFVAFTLALLLGNTLLPAGLYAAGLFCAVKPFATSHNNTTQNCFVHADFSNVDYGKTHTACPFQKTCDYAISSHKTDTQAIPQLSKMSPMVSTISIWFFDSINSNKPAHVSFDSSCFLSPPLYLKNSSFLN